jgi:tetratricopeptide (TPR) repeat protein
LNQIAQEFVKAEAILKRLAASAAGNEQLQRALFYARMETCYTKLLLALIKEKSQRDRELESLIGEYQKIAQDYPEAAIPHFRLDTIFAELGRDDDAFDELTKAIKLIDSDQFLRTPGHWVRSTMQRRVASRFSNEVAQQRRKLAEQPDPELQETYLRNLLSAFHSVYSSSDALRVDQSDYLYSLEARRRINNILYYASLLLEFYHRQDGFQKLGIEEPYMRRLISQLMPEGEITKVLEVGIIHTIGTAYAALGESELAARAGNHLLDIAKETEDAMSLADILSDAFSWIQQRSVLEPTVEMGAA